MIFLLQSFVLGSTPITMTLEGEKVSIETGKRVTSKLWWDSVPDADFYLLYRRIGNDDWQNIGTFDYSDDEPIKVLKCISYETREMRW